MTNDEIIKEATQRFLAWKLPLDFHPDCRITYTPPSPDDKYPQHPIGTNLFHFSQAEAMIRHIIGDLLPTQSAPNVDQVKSILDVHHNNSMAAERVVALFKEYRQSAPVILNHSGPAPTGVLFSTQSAPSVSQDEGWISVKDRLPDKDGQYFVFSFSADPSKPFRSVAWFDPENPGWQMIPIVWANSITYWRPLPPAPADKGGQ